MVSSNGASRSTLASDGRTGGRQLEAAADRVKLDSHAQPAAHVRRVAADQAADHLVALVQVDDDGCVRNLKRRRLRPPHDGPAVDLAGSRAALPPELGAS